MTRTNYAVQVCMPGQTYRTITKVTSDLSGKMDILLSLIRGTHKLSRKGMTVRVVAENRDFNFNTSPTADYWRVVKRSKVA